VGKFKTFCENEYEFQTFVKYLEEYETYLVNEISLPSFIQDKINFIKEIASIIGLNVVKLFDIFKNKIVFKFFSDLGWSL